MNANTPAPHINVRHKLKAFVLGCDPTAYDKNKNRVVFEKVFGIGQDGRYFAGIKANLKQLNISMDEIYVQNLITEYCDKESSKDKNWVYSAQRFIPSLVLEFDREDPSRKTPVFLTSELQYKALMNEGQKPKKPAELYNTANEIVVAPERNKLFRPLMPLYRHFAYSLKNHTEYKERLLKHFGF